MISACLNECVGPNHCWFNLAEENKDFFKRDGAFFVLVGNFMDDSASQEAGWNPIMMFEKVKSIQQR